MGGKGEDQDGFPHDILEQMQAGHEKFMREVEHEAREGRRLQQGVDRDGGKNYTWEARSTASTSLSPSSDKNIFVFFKDLVDSSLSSLTDSFMSLPSNIQELREKVQGEREVQDHEELGFWRRWAALKSSADHDEALARWTDLKEIANHNGALPVQALLNQRSNEALDAAAMLLREAQERNKHVRPESIHALYRDGSETGIPLMFAPPWLSIDWFKRSRYSPIRLEQDSLSQCAGGKWRAAFEDLLSATLDKPMTSTEQWGMRPDGVTQSTRSGSGIDWMLSLQCRGILPPQLPSLYNLSGVNPHACGSFVDTSPPHGCIAFAPWLREIDLSTAFCDFNDLAHEIETPASGQAEKLSGWKQHETELDLYNAQWDDKEVLGRQQAHHEDPRTDTLEQERERRWFREQQRCDAADDLWDALSNGNTDAATQCLRDWHHEHERPLGDILASLTSDDVTNFGPLLSAALRRSGLVDEVNDDAAERRRQECQALGLLPSDASRSTILPGQHTQVNVLSSLTTTQTTRLPDGTVTTKVLLKQRFADGREETEEKLHTYKEPLQAAEAPAAPESAKSEKKGWFWS
ncbi:hypothetical protein B0A50_03566 [Salinomyces thailandicus]|uniref:Uncharacterized protein n=1 Tax=Salinomyces thailandicus TaxID=706561 RepID=A0A4U0U3F2_9PEZI|nr:hypothetical protein B0A50_03566 [Salinomyces thailandica]